MVYISFPYRSSVALLYIGSLEIMRTETLLPSVRDGRGGECKMKMFRPKRRPNCLAFSESSIPTLRARSKKSISVSCFCCHQTRTWSMCLFPTNFNPKFILRPPGIGLIISCISGPVAMVGFGDAFHHSTVSTREMQTTENGGKTQSLWRS